MTREEQINNEATNYGYWVAGGSPERVNASRYFEQGVKWADTNPKSGLVDLSQVWHTAEREPETSRKVVAINEKGILFSGVYWPYDAKGYIPKYPGVYWNGGGCLNGARLLDWQEAVKWAYVDELLPKGGNDENMVGKK